MDKIENFFAVAEERYRSALPDSRSGILSSMLYEACVMWSEQKDCAFDDHIVERVLRFVRNAIEGTRDSEVRISVLDMLLREKDAMERFCEYALEVEKRDRGVARPSIVRRRLISHFEIISAAMKERVSQCEKQGWAQSDLENMGPSLPRSCSVSVIIPIYNAAKYVGETVDSVLSQTFEDFEVICIDDGSQDGSLDIVLMRANRDERVCVYRQANMGVSVARNNGLLLAKGAYVYFLDSDDLLEPEALEVMLKEAERDSLDILYFDGESFFETEELESAFSVFARSYKRRGRYIGVQQGASLIGEFFLNFDDFVPSWLSLFRREFLIDKGISYRPGVAHEDNAFFFTAGLLAVRAAHIDEILIRRRVRENSLMTKRRAFENSLGFYLGALDMIAALQNVETELDTKTLSSLKAIIFRTLRNAAKTLGEVPENEWGAVYALEEDCSAMQYIVQEPARDIVTRALLESDIRNVEDCLNARDRLIEEQAQSLNVMECEQRLLNQRIAELESALSSAEVELEKNRNEKRLVSEKLENVRSSWSFKVGKLATSPFRAAKKVIARLR